MEDEPRFEHDPYVPPSDEDAALEEQAATEEAFQVERDELDAAASEDYERDEGWPWEDELSPVIDIASGIANEACGRSQYVRDLEAHGYPTDAMEANYPLNGHQIMLVTGGLHLLGTLHDHLRPEVEALVEHIRQYVPELTDEEAEAFTDATAAVMSERFGGLPVQIVPLEEAQALIEDEEQARRDAELN